MHKLKNICPLFIGLNKNELSLVESKMVLRDFRSKEIILRESNENSQLFIIRSGVVRVDTYSNNKRQTLSFLKEGDFFGEIAVFTGVLVSANVVSVVNSEIFTLKKEDLDELIKKIPALAQNIISYLALRVKKADKVIYDYAFKMLESRVASKLLHLMAMFQGKDSEKTFINLPITHQDLADYVGTSRETVTKILAKFRDRGIIDIKTKKITILDEKRLESWGID
jgi:CRP/FNR family transcriptional regulator